MGEFGHSHVSEGIVIEHNFLNPCGEEVLANEAKVGVVELIAYRLEALLRQRLTDLPQETLALLHSARSRKF